MIGRCYRWIVIAAVAGSSFASNAHAHSRPSKHTAVVQVEDEMMVLYVAWTPPTGLLAPLLLARASVLVPKDVREGLARLMARMAMRPIEVRIDEVPLRFERSQKKLVLDGDGRYTVAVLAEANVASAKQISVRSTAANLQIAWSNLRRTTRASSTIPAQTWTRESLSIRLHSESEPRRAPVCRGGRSGCQ